MRLEQLKLWIVFFNVQIIYIRTEVMKHYKIIYNIARAKILLHIAQN